MFLNYTRLFNLRLSHNYFVLNRPIDIGIRPTAKTRNLLKGGRMLFKPIPHGFTVLYEALEDEITPVVRLGGTVKLTFILTVADANRFQNITRLDMENEKPFSSSNILIFRNNPDDVSHDTANPEVITHELLDSIRSKNFTYSFSISESVNEVIFRLTDEAGIPVSPGTDGEGNPLPSALTLTSGDDGIFRQRIELSRKPDGIYRITIRNQADTDTLKEEFFYADDNLTSQTFFGLAEITYDQSSGNMYGDTEEFELSFRRKATFWKYLIVNKNRRIEDPGELQIEDETPEDSEVYERLQFIREGDAPHSEIRINDLDTVVFRSESSIPFYELPKPSVQLRRDGGTVLIQNLPNPSTSRTMKKSGDELVSEVYVFI